MHGYGGYPDGAGGEYGPPADYQQPWGVGELGRYGRVGGYDNRPTYPWEGRRRRWRRRLTTLAVAGVLAAIGIFVYVKVYIPHVQQAQAAVTVPDPVLGNVPAVSGSVGSKALPTLAWKPWLASTGNKDRVSMELGDTTLVDARQKAQAALSSGKNISAAGMALAKAAAAELKVVQGAKTAPLPPKGVQAAWARSLAELTRGAGQLATAAQAMQGGNKAAATHAIAASMPDMNAAFADLIKIDRAMPAP